MNKLIKKTAAAIITGAITLSTPATLADAAAFSDIGKLPASVQQAITAVAERGIMIGGLSGKFNPSENTTRTQMVITLVRLLGLDTSKKPSKATFKDVPTTHWAFSYIEAAYKHGIIKVGLNGNFGVNEECTREQMAIMFVRALGITDDQLIVNQDLSRILALKDEAQISSWAKDSVEFVMSVGLMNGVGNSSFAPQGVAKREQVAQMLYRFIQNNDEIVQYAKSLNAPLHNLELYQALLNSLKDYKAEFESKLSVSITDSSANGGLQIDTMMSGKINSPNYQTSTQITTRIGDDVVDDSKYEFITIGDSIYVKLPGGSKWYKRTPKQIEESGMSSLEYNYVMGRFSDFIRGYNKMPVVKTPNVLINNINTTKYSVTLDGSRYKSLLTSILPPEMLGGSGAGTIGDSSLVMEIYLDGQNRIVADRFSYSAKINSENTSDKLNIEILMDSSYSKIGEDIKITAPDSSLIEK